MADNGNAQGLGGVNKATPLGQSKESSNEWLGIDSRVAKGTVSAREVMTYGGEQDEGVLFKGNSVGSPSKEMNSGNAEKNSASTGQYGPGSYDMGGYGSRENMTLGGGANKGKYVGDGVNSTKVSSFDQMFSGLPVQPGMDLEHGTSDFVKNEQKATKGIGGGRTKLPKNKD